MEFTASKELPRVSRVSHVNLRSMRTDVIDIAYPIIMSHSEKIGHRFDRGNGSRTDSVN